MSNAHNIPALIQQYMSSSDSFTVRVTFSDSKTPAFQTMRVRAVLDDGLFGDIDEARMCSAQSNMIVPFSALRSLQILED